ncbi:MAG: GNVR domain-containing protein [Candidatus Acidiferrales bacterium]
MATESANLEELLAQISASNGNHTGASGERAVRDRNIARVRLFWNRRELLGRVAAVGLLASLLTAFVIPVRYNSTTRLMPPENQSSSSLMMMAALSGKGGGLGNIAGDLLGLKSTGALFTAILLTRTVQDRLVTQFDLEKVYGSRIRADARLRLQENTQIAEDLKSGIITIAVTDHNAKRAAELARAYVTELNTVVVELNTSSAHRERVFLEGRLVEVRRDLEIAEQNFSEFASKNTAINIEAQGKAMIEAAGTLEGQLIAAQTELESLKQVYAAGNVRVRATQARVDEIQRRLQDLRGHSETSTQSAGPAFPSIRELPLLGVTYADLYRQTKVQEAVFETLTQQNELAKVQEAKETPSVKVIDPAEVAERRSYPPRLLITILGTCLSVAGAMSWIFLASNWREIDTQDPRKILAREVFQTVKVGMFRRSQNSSGRGSVVSGTTQKVYAPHRGQ